MPRYEYQPGTHKFVRIQDGMFIVDEKRDKFGHSDLVQHEELTEPLETTRRDNEDEADAGLISTDLQSKTVIIFGVSSGLRLPKGAFWSPARQRTVEVVQGMDPEWNVQSENRLE